MPNFKNGEFEGQGILEMGLFMKTAEERRIPLDYVTPFGDKGYHQAGLASQLTILRTTNCKSTTVHCLLISVDVCQTTWNTMFYLYSNTH